MFEKVNPMHPDKVADRIAGAIVDLCYSKVSNPKVAVEVLIGHGDCNIIAETNVKNITYQEVDEIVKRITKVKTIKVFFNNVAQDVHLAENQNEKVRCGDNGIFKGVPTSREEVYLSTIAKDIYKKFPSDGKYVLTNDNRLIIVRVMPKRMKSRKSSVHASSTK